MTRAYNLLIQFTKSIPDNDNLGVCRSVAPCLSLLNPSGLFFCFFFEGFTKIDDIYTTGSEAVASLF